MKIMITAVRNVITKLFKSGDFRIFFFVFVVFIIVVAYKYLLLSSSSKYGIGTTINRRHGKLGYVGVNYTYEVDGKSYSAEYSEKSIFKSDLKLKVPNQDYLIFYSTKRPVVSRLIGSVEISDHINIDSLNQVGVSPELIDIFD